MSTDIDNQKLIFQRTPPALHPYLKLARLDRPIGTWLLLLPGWWSILLASHPFDGLPLRTFTYIVLFGLGALLMRGAGCVVNDIWDRKLDAQVERTRTRPLPAGDVTLRQALGFLAGLLAVSFLILLCFNKLTIALGITSLTLVVSYPAMKRVTWWPQAFLGLTFNWGALLGWAAVTGSLGFAPLLLYAGGICWTLAYDTIYAHQDKEDDAMVGIKSTALLFGDKSKTYVWRFYIAAIVLFAAARALCGFSGWAAWMIIPLLAHVWWMMKSWNPDDSASSLKTFKANRDFGLIVLLMCLI